MKTHTLTQCRLVKRVNATTTREQMAYIPTRYAKENNVIKIKDANGVWEDGWRVLFIYHTIDDVVSARQSIKKHRKNTGDSLKKEKK